MGGWREMIKKKKKKKTLEKKNKGFITCYLSNVFFYCCKCPAHLIRACLNVLSATYRCYFYASHILSIVSACSTLVLIPIPAQLDDDVVLAWLVTPALPPG